MTFENYVGERETAIRLLNNSSIFGLNVSLLALLPYLGERDTKPELILVSGVLISTHLHQA